MKNLDHKDQPDSSGGVRGILTATARCPQGTYPLSGGAGRLMTMRRRSCGTIEEIINKYNPGGIAYFAGPASQGIPNNVDNPRHIASLSNGIQRAATQQPAQIPMLIATDQEQGVVVRVREPATQFPGSMALGATRNAGYAKQAAQITLMPEDVAVEA